MISFKLNGQSIAIPTTWNEVTFKQYIAMFDLKDDNIQLVSIFTGMDYDHLKKAVIIGLENILTALSFINKPPVFPGSVSEVGPYKIPNNQKGAFNIQHESLAQFEDMRQIMRKLPTGDVKEHTKAYIKYVAIYIQKIKDGDYNPLKVQEVEEELQNYPAYQIITLGSFFFLKLWSLSTPTPKSSPNISPSLKKSKPVMKGSKKRSGRSARSSKRLKR